MPKVTVGGQIFLYSDVIPMTQPLPARGHRTALILTIVALAAAALMQSQPGSDLGFTDTPILPHQKWHVHDPARPYPRVVTPGAAPGLPPSDAAVLFDGKDLSKWANMADGGKLVDARWTLGDGYFEVAPQTGMLYTREKFGDCQLHIEWASPAIFGSEP